MTVEVEKNAKEAAKLLKALSNEKRLLILCTLYKGECSVGELEEVVNLSQSALSQHLSKLRCDNLVMTRREAQTIYYSLEDRAVKMILGTLHDIFAPNWRDGSCLRPDQR